jgi:hypothetical protein
MGPEVCGFLVRHTADLPQASLLYGPPHRRDPIVSCAVARVGSDRPGDDLPADHWPNTGSTGRPAIVQPAMAPAWAPRDINTIDNVDARGLSRSGPDPAGAPCARKSVPTGMPTDGAREWRMRSVAGRSRPLPHTARSLKSKRTRSRGNGRQRHPAILPELPSTTQRSRTRESADPFRSTVDHEAIATFGIWPASMVCA